MGCGRSDEPAEACPSCGEAPCRYADRLVPAAELCVLEHHRVPCRPRRALDGLRVCPGHRAGLARELLELPEMYERLVARHSAGSSLSEIRAGGHAGLSLDPRVTRARDELRTMLASWCRAVAEDRDFSLPADSVQAMADYLLGRRGAMLDWVCAQPWVADFRAGIDAVHRDAFRLLHPRGARHVPVAPCQAPLWSDVATRTTVTCPGVLVVTFRGGDGERFPDAVCDDCGREFPPAQWRRLADRDLRLSVPEIADLWRLPVQTVYRWAVTNHWVTDGGRPARYSVADAERTLHRLRPEQATA